MSKKRKSPESSNDEQTTEGSDCELMQAVFQHEDNTKRAKLFSLSDTTLQDLPVEIIECILVKAVAMEVKAMKLAKRVWKEKADLVISRLRTVSSHWSSILTTNYFRNELHRTLDGYAQETIRWEILLQPSIHSCAMRMTSMRDEVFMLCFQEQCFVVNVFDRNNLVEPKDVIPISEFHLGDMLACSVSNCVYLLNANWNGPSVIRITKDEHQFKTSVWIKNLRLPTSGMGPIVASSEPSVVSIHNANGSVECDSRLYPSHFGLFQTYNIGPMSTSANGNLIILARQRSPEPTVVGIYDANGFVQHEIRLSPVVYGFGCLSSVIQKSNGNLLLVSSNNTQEAKLLEIDVSGRIIREYQSPYIGAGVESCEDINGRIVVNYSGGRIELLDSELNLLDIVVKRLADGEFLDPFRLHYNSERHEIVGVRFDWDSNICCFVTFRYTVE